MKRVMNWIGAAILALALLTMVLADVVLAASVDNMTVPPSGAQAMGGTTGITVAPANQG